MMIKTLPRCRREPEQSLGMVGSVQPIHAINGEYDIIAIIEAGGNARLNELIDTIGLLEGIERTTTSITFITNLER